MSFGCRDEGKRTIDSPGRILRQLIGTEESTARLSGARRYQASVARLGRIVRHLSANRRIRIRSDILSTNVIHIVGAIGRAPLLLGLRRMGLRSLGAYPLRGAIARLRKNGSRDQGNQGRSRKQFLHGIVS